MKSLVSTTMYPPLEHKINNSSQDLLFCSPALTNATSRLVYNTHTHEHLPHPFRPLTVPRPAVPLQTRAARPNPDASGNQISSAQKMASSYWIHSPRTRRMIP